MCLLAPWLLLGALIAGFISVFLPADWLRHNLSGRAGVIRSVLLGVPLPLCSCGVIPTGIGLKKNGASDGACIGFLISTPQTGVDSILVSASFLGWPFAIFKMALAAITGWTGGLLCQNTEWDSSDETHNHHAHQHGGNLLAQVIGHSIEVVQSIWRWLLAGVIVSAAISLWIVPTNVISELAQYGLMASLLAMLLISLPLYVCATASVPIAAALVQAGLPTAAALVFLIAGPATNLGTVGAVKKHFGTRNTIIYLLTIVLGSILGAVVFDWFIGGTLQQVVGDGHHHTGWFAQLCAAMLSAMFLWFAIFEFRDWYRRRTTTHDATKTSTWQVQGMTCQNCVKKLERALLNTDEVDSATVDLEAGTVIVGGDASQGSIQQVVNDCGFQGQLAKTS